LRINILRFLAGVSGVDTCWLRLNFCLVAALDPGVFH
jgi:hypothetical protein